MPGQPRKRALIKSLTDRGGPDALRDHLLGGGTIAGLGRELGVERGFLRRNLMKLPDYAGVLDEVRETAADTHAELGFEIIRELRDERKAERATAAPGTRAAEIGQVDVSIAREEIAQHKFIAEAWSQRYANKGGQTNVTLNLGEMHLDALRKMKTVHEIQTTPVAVELTRDE